MSETAEVALKTIKAVEERDAERLLELWHDDVEFHEPPSLPYGGTKRGKLTVAKQLETAPRDSWLGTWDALQPTAEERRMSPRVVAESGSEAAIVYTMRAISPAGERFECEVLGLYEVRDGKFARAQMFHFDTAATAAFLERAGRRL